MKKLNKLFSLGDIYVSDFIKNDEDDNNDQIIQHVLLQD